MITQQAREGEERGRGVPLSDVSRVMRHYNIDEETACYWLTIHTIEELVPERGYGLTTAAQREIVGYTRNDLEVALNAMEESLPTGGKAKLELCTEALPTEEALAESYLNMAAAGFHLSYPSARLVQGVPTTQFTLQKGSPQWALLIPLILPILILFVVTFRIEAIAKSLLPLLIAGAVGLVAVALIVKKPAERIAERYLPKA